jgi:para-aminobenzoate synthetase component I
MHIVEIPYINDSSFYYEKIRHLRWPVFLDSSYQKDRAKSEIARYDIIAAEPFIRVTSGKSGTYIEDSEGRRLQNKIPIKIIEEIMEKYSIQNQKLPFIGGAIGYLSYDLKNNTKKNSLIPKMIIGIYDWTVVIDHLKSKAWLIQNNFDKKPSFCWSSLQELFNTPTKNTSKNFAVIGDVDANLNLYSYRKKFTKVSSYIKEGDCYQVNLSQKYKVSTSGDSWIFYKKFRVMNKSPYMAYLSYDDFEIMSGSPEQFIQSRNKNITTRPIKGTRARDNDPVKDKANLKELSLSLKDQAENLMIVDLLRNDLAINCELGSIKVDELFTVESYPNVHHLVSSITATLKNNSNNYKLLNDAFPGGSITGTPKSRAIEIIDELEEHSRDVYCGSVIYFSFNQMMDSNIAIRSMIHQDHILHFYSGGGLTVDSTATSEYQEIKDKAQNIINTINFFKDSNAAN